MTSLWGKIAEMTEFADKHKHLPMVVEMDAGNRHLVKKIRFASFETAALVETKDGIIAPIHFIKELIPCNSIQEAQAQLNKITR